MRYEIRKSDDQGFYYLLKIDAENNQTVLMQDKDLDKIYAHKSLKGDKPKPIDEHKTRGLFAPSEEDE